MPLGTKTPQGRSGGAIQPDVCFERGALAYASVFFGLRVSRPSCTATALLADRRCDDFHPFVRSYQVLPRRPPHTPRVPPSPDNILSVTQCFPTKKGRKAGVKQCIEDDM